MIVTWFVPGSIDQCIMLVSIKIRINEKFVLFYENQQQFVHFVFDLILILYIIILYSLKILYIQYDLWCGGLLLLVWVFVKGCACCARKFCRGVTSVYEFRLLFFFSLAFSFGVLWYLNYMCIPEPVCISHIMHWLGYPGYIE